MPPDEPYYLKNFAPALFEWEPQEAPEEEVFADLAAIGTEPEFFKDEEVRTRYVAYLAEVRGQQP